MNCVDISKKDQLFKKIAMISLVGGRWGSRARRVIPNISNLVRRRRPKECRRYDHNKICRCLNRSRRVTCTRNSTS